MRKRLYSFFICLMLAVALAATAAPVNVNAATGKVSVAQLQRMFPTQKFWTSPDGDPYKYSDYPEWQGVMQGNVYNGATYCDGFAQFIYFLWNGVDKPNIPVINEAGEDLYPYIEAGDLIDFWNFDEDAYVGHSFFVCGKNGNELETVEANVVIYEEPGMTNRITWSGEHYVAEENMYYGNLAYTHNDIKKLGAKKGQVHLYKGVGNTKVPDGREYSIAGNANTSQPPSSSGTINRLYNPADGDHIYTVNAAEASLLASNGWNIETSPGVSAGSEGVPIYRIVNVATGENLYTSDKNEVNVQVASGNWFAANNGNPVFYGAQSGKGFYRLYNPHAGNYPKTAHHFTADPNEVKVLTTQQGWQADNNGQPLFYLAQ